MAKSGFVAQAMSEPEQPVKEAERGKLCDFFWFLLGFMVFFVGF